MPLKIVVSLAARLARVVRPMDSTSLMQLFSLVTRLLFDRSVVVQPTPIAVVAMHQLLQLIVVQLVAQLVHAALNTDSTCLFIRRLDSLSKSHRLPLQLWK
jgi:hypothetical protein